MKITDIQAIVLSSKYDRAIRFAHMDLSERRIILVKVFTDEGLVGIADIDGPPAGDMACVTLVEQRFKPLLLGKNPLEIGKRWNEMFYVLDMLGRYRSLESYVLGAIDTALWDILGKATGKSVATLLGKQRDSVETYASLGQVSADAIEDEVAKRYAEGFKGVKIRIGFNTDEDETLVARARKAAGDGARLMADANSGWRRSHAVSFGKRLERYGLFWLEEPLPPYDLTGYAQLAAALDTPVALGEHEIFNQYDARDILLAQAGDILQPDLRQGISEVWRIACLARAWGIPCVPHFFGPGIRFAAMLQLLGAIDNYLICEYPVAHDPIRFELTDNPMRSENGVIAIPDGPGLGVSLVDEVVERFTLR